MLIEHSILLDYYYLGIFLLIIASFISGLLDSIAGGGGLILVPASIIVGIPPQTALGQENMVSTIGTLAAILNYIKNKMVVWKIVMYGIPFSLVGGLVGCNILLRIDESDVGKIILLLIPFGFTFSFFSKKYKFKIKDFNQSKSNLVSIVFIICLLVGFYDGFFGPGSGSLFLLALTFFLRMPLIQSSATSKILGLASNIGAFIIFCINGKMLFFIGIPMVVANVFGNYIGSNLSLKRGETIIRPIIYTSVSILFISLAIKYYGDICIL